MAGETKRVDFNAPETLIDRADVVTELLDRSRTSLLIDALRKELDEIVTDEAFRRRVKEAYYADRIDFETLETVIGREEAMRIELLRESLAREPPVPESEAFEVPADSDFYDGTLPKWTPESDESEEDAASTSR